MVAAEMREATLIVPETVIGHELVDELSLLVERVCFGEQDPFYRESSACVGRKKKRLDDHEWRWWL